MQSLDMNESTIVRLALSFRCEAGKNVGNEIPQRFKAFAHILVFRYFCVL